MAPTPLLARSVYACTRCQRRLLHSIAAFAGAPPSCIAAVPAKPLHAAPRPLLQPRQSSIQGAIRSYSEQVTRREQAALPDVAGLEEVEDATAHEAADVDDSPQEEDLPWYLRQEIHDGPHREPPRHLADRQKLPGLPDLPPPLLQTLLEHISVDLGLDDLSLLDLRALDPPSALGSNLIMVVGTARSEKHLHVSADRFCRHLRTAHKLRAHADGLLGRGELKIRMRRMAKRSRLLANVGAVNTRRSEDDLRTGWVCVLVEGLQPHPEWEGPKQRPDFIGFDERSDRINFVVQMFTETKREEIDLETLWNRRSERAAKELAGDSAEGSTSTGYTSPNETNYDMTHDTHGNQPSQAVAG